MKKTNLKWEMISITWLNERNDNPWMPPQYPGTYTWKYGRNDVDGFRVMHIRSFRFIFILRVAPQQTHAAVAVVRAGYPSPDYRGAF